MTLPALTACLRISFALVPGLPMSVSGGCPDQHQLLPVYGPERPTKLPTTIRPRTP